MGPPAADYRKEITWLRSYPQVAPRVFYYDEEFNAFFMERFSPAETLWKWSLADRDDDATRVLAEMIRRLYLTPATAPQEIPVPHLAELGSAFAVLRGRIDAALLTKAEGLWKELTVPSGHDVFLHGDLHHDNVLSNGAEWKVIDPHGYLGDPASEIGSLIYNPLEWWPQDLSARLERRLAILTEELPWEAPRLRAWAFAKTMLSIAWSSENDLPPPPHEVAIAEVLHRFC